MITQEILKEYFTYADGSLVWIKRASRGTHVGDIAGALTSKGYWQIGIKSCHILAHRAVFLYHKGHLPKYLDHIDGDPLNNRIENLRGCSVKQNQYNSALRTDNTSGVKGVSKHKDTGRWIAQVSFSGKRNYIGSFSCLSDAEKAVKKARETLHKEFTNHG